MEKNRGFAISPGKQKSNASFTTVLPASEGKVARLGQAVFTSSLGTLTLAPPRAGNSRWTGGMDLGARLAPGASGRSLKALAQREGWPCAQTHIHTHTIKSPSHNLKGHHQQPHHLTPSPKASQIPHPCTHLREHTHTCCTCKKLGWG